MFHYIVSACQEGDATLISFLRSRNSLIQFLYRNYWSKYLLIKYLPTNVETCVRYFLFFSSNDSPSKTMKNAFDFI